MRQETDMPEIESVTPEDFDRRIIPPSAFVADEAAFLDVRLPDSQGKLNYSMIGPGVSQNPDQHVNVRESHGFNLGAAGLPGGAINSQHLHYTAEVFVSLGGEYEFRVGVESDQRIAVSGRFVFSVPTWIFRGFRNVGTDDITLYAVLGGDDTGGIMWSPKVMHQASLTGLYLTVDGVLLDTESGDVIDDSVELVSPMSETDIDSLRRYTDAELAERLIADGDLAWSDRALLDAVLPGHASRLAPVLGWGMTMDRDHEPPIRNLHGFSIEWLAVAGGESVSTHRHSDTQVLLIADPGWTLEVNVGPDKLSRSLEPGSVVSVPRNAWRSFRNESDKDAVMLVINGGESRTRIEWPAETVGAAEKAGWGIDASGYLAPKHLLGQHFRAIP